MLKLIMVFVDRYFLIYTVFTWGRDFKIRYCELLLSTATVAVDKQTIISELIFMIEYFIFKLSCSNREKMLKLEENSRLKTHSED